MCPDFSQSPVGNGNQSNYLCNTGYTGVDGGTCILCVAGKYETTTGNALCSVCAAGTYSGEVGATSNVCIGCPVDSNSNDTSIIKTDCICNAGSSGPDGGPCVKCVCLVLYHFVLVTRTKHIRGGLLFLYILCDENKN